MDYPMYAIVTHGKIKSFAQLGHTEGHNDRSVKVLPDNVRPDGPAPITLVGKEGANLGEVAKAKLRSHGINPANVRKNGVIANEDIYSASPAFFGDPAAWCARSPEEWRRNPWVVATVAFLKKVHNENLISVVLHLDERTPHLHAITLPLVEKARTKRGRLSNAERSLPPSERPARPTVTSVQLDCRSLRGQEKWQLEPFVTEYAKAVEHLGLKRGRLISGLTKEERDQRAEKASPKIAAAKDALEAGAARARQLEQMARVRAEEADTERRRLQIEALAVEAARAQAKVDQEHALALDRQRTHALMLRTEENRQAAQMAEQRLIQAQRREAELSRREEDLDLHLKGADMWENEIIEREQRLWEGEAQLESERSLFEKTKEELLRRYQLAMAMLRRFFVGKGMTFEVDALDGRPIQPAASQQKATDPTAIAAAAHHAALRKLAGQER